MIRAWGCIIVVLIGSVVASLAQTTGSTAVVPNLVNFSGTLTDTNSKPLTSITGVTFSLYANQEGGSPLWLETQNVQPDKNGHYSVMLGSATSQGLPSDLFASGEARWLGVQAQGQAEQPRIMLLSVPYAMKAGDAQTIGGLPPSAFVLAAPGTTKGTTSSPIGVASSGTASTPSGPVTGSGRTGYIPIWTSTSNLSSSTISETSSGLVGIGTTAPSATLTVNGAVSAGTSFNLGTYPFAFGTHSQQNAFLGYAGNTTTTGTQLTAVGDEALSANTIGYLNTAVGFQALYENTEGYLNTADGGQALEVNTSGANNTALGYAALGANTTGNENTATGMQAMVANTAGGLNTASGYRAMFSNQGSYNTATGAEALENNSSGTQNTATGALAMGGSTAGSDNTAAGYVALYNNTGSNNTAMGMLALNQNTSGDDNTGVGNLALTANTTGTYNTGLGYNTLLSNTTGNLNTAVGYLSGQALSGATLASSNTFLGAQANASTQSMLTNATAIGANAQVTANNSMVLGSINGLNGAGASTNVGIGTTSPQYTLDVQGINANFKVTTGFGVSSAGSTLSVGPAGVTLQGPIIQFNSPTNFNGLAYIPSATISNLIGSVEIGGSVAILTNPAAGDLLTLEQGGGPAIGDGWSTYSSRRWKTNIKTLPDALSKVERLRGVSYDLKDSGKHEIGVIAEEVGKVVPEVVTYEENGKDARGVDYSRLTALLIEATKEQQALIRKQQQQIRAQQVQLRAQQSELNAQHARGQIQDAQIAELRSQVKAIQASLKTNGRGGSEIRTVKAQVPMVQQ